MVGRGSRCVRGGGLELASTRSQIHKLVPIYQDTAICLDIVKRKKRPRCPNSNNTTLNNSSNNNITKNSDTNSSNDDLLEREKGGRGEDGKSRRKRTRRRKGVPSRCSQRFIHGPFSRYSSHRQTMRRVNND